MDNRGARIVITRPRGGYRDWLRAYSIVVDGVPRGRITRGETLVIDVAQGPHQIQAVIDWASSELLRVEAAEGEDVHINVWPGGNAFQFYQAFSGDGYISISRD